MKMSPCRNLDYDEVKYGEQCKLRVIRGFSCEVKCWVRQVVPYEGDSINVQFCKLYGRINGIFQCYNHGEMSCHDAGDT